MSWPWNRSRKTPEAQFVDEMTGLVQSVLGVKATRVEGFALSIETPTDTYTLNLHNIYGEAQRLTGDARAAMLRTALLAIKDHESQPATWEEVAPRLMPAVRTVGWLNEVTGVAHRKLAPFVVLACAIDSPHGMSFATEKDLSRWGVSAGDAMERAAANLAKLEVQVGRAGPTAIVMGPDGYVSSWLAAPARLRAIGGDLGSEVIAFAPERDRLLMVSTSDPALTLKLLHRVVEDYQKAPRHLSPVPYRVMATGVEPWDPPSTHPARPFVNGAKRLLANVEYGYQTAALQDQLTKAGEDVFVGGYSLVQRPDASTFSWAVWPKQVTNGLLPEVDVVVLGDNDDRSAALAVPWRDALEVCGSALIREALDPPRWRYRGWPDASTLALLRAASVTFPPPADVTDRATQ